MCVCDCVNDWVALSQRGFYVYVIQSDNTEPAISTVFTSPIWSETLLQNSTASIWCHIWPADVAKCSCIKFFEILNLLKKKLASDWFKGSERFLTCLELCVNWVSEWTVWGEEGIRDWIIVSLFLSLLPADSSGNGHISKWKVANWDSHKISSLEEQSQDWVPGTQGGFWKLLGFYL